MRSIPIALNKTEDVLNFVRLVSRYEEDVDLKSGSIIVDAKSIIGAVNLVGSSTLEMQVHGDDCDLLLSSVAEYIKG